MANRNFPNKGNLFAPHCKPVLLDCEFTVDNTTGTGISSLKGSGMIKAVYMNASTASAANSPNPAAGTILVQFKDNYQRYLGGSFQLQSPNSGTPISISGGSVLTIGAPYTITSVGTSTTANWVAAGVPAGITPAVGVTFLAAITGSGTGTGAVQAPAAAGSTIETIEVVGSPNTTNAPNPSSTNGIGGYIVLRCLAATNSSTTTLAIKAPAAGTRIRLEFLFDDSSVLPGDGGA